MWRALVNTKHFSPLPATRSSFLPAPFVHVVDHDQADTFVELFNGDSDTPSVVWNSSMRRRLRDQVAQHIASFANQVRDDPDVEFSFVDFCMPQYEGDVPFCFERGVMQEGGLFLSAFC